MPTDAVYQFSRLQQHEGQPWWYLLVGLGLAALVAFAWVMIRRDTVQLRPPIRYLLLLLRVTAVAGLVFFFLGLQRRSVYESVRNSRTRAGRRQPEYGTRRRDRPSRQRNTSPRG